MRHQKLTHVVADLSQPSEGLQAAERRADADFIMLVKQLMKIG
jgi:hypothetical protein